LNQDKAYELLGVKPGVSNRELKAAHRDLTKVWHPDRFLHDPRLQQKAQEKLKEINEAYELLLSGKTPRPAPSPETYTPARRKAPRRHGSWAVVLLVFVAVFAITTKLLLDRRPHPAPEPEVIAQPEPEPSSTRTTAVEKPAKPTRDEPAPEVASNETVVAPAAMPTVTVTIDPESGLLAKPECRLRSRMTYPSGSEPTVYCNLSHTPPPKEGRVKSLAKSVKRALN
jgi:hypothetical protein